MGVEMVKGSSSMKHSLRVVQFLSVLALGCSSVDRTEVGADVQEGASPAVLVDTLQWNGERLDFYEATDRDGVPGIVMSTLGREGEPDLLVTLERQLGRSPTAAELWLATGAEREDVPAELLAAHEVQALAEGRDPVLERVELDVGEVEKALPQSTFNSMFPGTSDSTGILPGQPAACWDAFLTQTPVGSTGRFTCSGTAAAVGVYSGLFSCVPEDNLNATVRTGVQNFSGGVILSAMNCFSTGSAPDTCQGAVTLNPNFFFALSFFKNGQKHRVGTGAQRATSSTSSFVVLGAADLVPNHPPTFGNTTCTSH
jgi:hypothetical protein